MAAIEQHIAGLPRETRHPQQNPHAQLIVQLLSKLRLADLRAICLPAASGARPGLESEQASTMLKQLSAMFFNPSAGQAAAN